jgi:hypothetical protein
MGLFALLLTFFKTLASTAPQGMQCSTSLLHDTTLLLQVLMAC